MPSEQTPKMDVFSDSRVPFHIAAWCRGRKHNKHAVELMRKLKEAAEVQAQLSMLEKKDAALYGDIRGLCKKIEEQDAQETNIQAEPPRSGPPKGTGQLTRVKAA